MPEDDIEGARRSTSDGLGFTVMITMDLKVDREPTAVTDALAEELRSLGQSNREVADVVGVVALNVITGAFNLMAGLTPETTG